MGKEGKEGAGNARHCKGRLSIIGTGPGSIEDLTPRANTALMNADTVIGYGRYLDLIAALTEGKDVIRSKMREEVDRAKEAVRLAIDGKSVAMVSGGDAGIYGMAGLILTTLGTDEFKDAAEGVEVEVVPGVPAFVAAAAALGAPLMHDFASVSLSDLLTPWEKITERLTAAAKADFVIALYNPRSRGRTTQLPKAVEIIRGHRAPSTPVGIVKNATREDESIALVKLKDLSDRYEKIDMSTILIIGNSSTFKSFDRMVTPRGYREVELSR